MKKDTNQPWGVIKSVLYLWSKKARVFVYYAVKVNKIVSVPFAKLPSFINLQLTL